MLLSFFFDKMIKCCEVNFSTIILEYRKKVINLKKKITKLSSFLFLDTRTHFTGILVTIFYLASKVRSTTFSRLALLLFESRSNIHLHSSPVHRDASCFSSGSPRAACRFILPPLELKHMYRKDITRTRLDRHETCKG